MKAKRNGISRLRIAVMTALVASGGAWATSSQAAELFFDFNLNLVSPNASLFLFGDAGQTATVTNLAGFSSNVTLGADGFFNLTIPNTYQQGGTGTRDTGFRVVSPDPIAGYFINRATASTDMTYLLDSKALGTNYVVASQGGGFGEGSQVMIHATQDNTTITFTPKGGSAINVTLNAGETYKYAGAATDLTGSRITASKDVAVFGGHACAQVPVGRTFCDTLLEQMIPTDKLSKSYALTASAGADLSGNDLVRVISTAANTEVRVNGALVATLSNAGDVYEFSLPANSGAMVTSNNAVMVAQYLIGGQGANTDPAMSLVPGSDSWLDEYRLSTPSGSQAFNVNYASVVINTADLATLLLDGLAVNTSGFAAIGGTPYSRGIVNLPLGLFDLVARNPFLVMLGGGSLADSYFTYGGATFAPGVSPPPPPPDPVPEPGTLALLGLGLAGLGLAKRRKRQ